MDDSKMKHMDTFWTRDRAWTAPVNLMTQAISSDDGVFAQPPPYPLALKRISNQSGENNRNPGSSDASPPDSHTSPAGSNPSPNINQLSPGNSYLSPNSSNTSPYGSHLSPSGSYLSPNGSYLSPVGSYHSPTANHYSPGGSYLSPNGSYLGPNGSYHSLRLSPNGGNVCSSGSSPSPAGSYLYPNGSYLSPVGSPVGSSVSPGGSFISAGFDSSQNNTGSNSISYPSSYEGSYYLSPVGSYVADTLVNLGHVWNSQADYVVSSSNVIESNIGPNQGAPATNESIKTISNHQQEKAEASGAKAAENKSDYSHLHQWLSTQDTAELASLDGKSIITRLLRHVKVTRRQNNAGKARGSQQKGSKDGKNDEEGLVNKVAWSGISERQKFRRSGRRSKGGKKLALNRKKVDGKQTEVSYPQEESQKDEKEIKKKIQLPNGETKCHQQVDENVTSGERSPQNPDKSREIDDIACESDDGIDSINNCRENTETRRVSQNCDKPSESFYVTAHSLSNNSKEYTKGQNMSPSCDNPAESDGPSDIKNSVGNTGVNCTPIDQSVEVHTSSDLEAVSAPESNFCESAQPRKPIKRRNSIYPMPKGRYAFKSSNRPIEIFSLNDCSIPATSHGKDKAIYDDVRIAERNEVTEATKMESSSSQTVFKERLSSTKKCSHSVNAASRNSADSDQLNKVVSKSENGVVKDDKQSREQRTKYVIEDNACSGKSRAENAAMKDCLTWIGDAQITNIAKQSEEESFSTTDVVDAKHIPNSGTLDKAVRNESSDLSNKCDDDDDDDDDVKVCENYVKADTSYGKDDAHAHCLDVEDSERIVGDTVKGLRLMIHPTDVDEDTTKLIVHDEIMSPIARGERDVAFILSDHAVSDDHDGKDNVEETTVEENVMIDNSDEQRMPHRGAEKNNLLDTTTGEENETSNEWSDGFGSNDKFDSGNVGNYSNEDDNVSNNVPCSNNKVQQEISKKSLSGIGLPNNCYQVKRAIGGVDQESISSEDDALKCVRRLYIESTEFQEESEGLLHQGEVSMVTSANGAMEGQGIPSQYSPQTYYYAEREPPHRDPPPYPGHYKHLYQAGYRQSYSGSEASTDLSSTSTENLSITTRQDPQGEETIQVAPSPGPLDSPTYKDFPILSQLASLPVEIRTSNSNTFYMTGSRGTSGSPELQSQSTSPVNFNSQNNSTNGASNKHAMYSTSPMHYSQPQQLTPEMLSNLRLACHSPQPQVVPRPEIPRPATAPPIPVPTSIALVTQNNYPPPPSYPHSLTSTHGVTPESLRRSYELLDRLTTHTRSQPDLTRPVNTATNNTAAVDNSRRSPQVGLTPIANSNNTSIQQQTSPNTLHKQILNQDKKKFELDHAAIATRATQMVERLSDENRSLRQELDNYLKKVSVLQKFELEIQKVNDDYENLVKHSQKRENLEKMLRFRLEAELKKQRDANVKLRAQLNNQSKEVKDPSLRDESQKDKHGQDSLLTKLLNQNKELMTNNEHLDIEVAAQRATLKEQRNHIDILDTALVNAQANIIHLQEQLRKKVMCEERLDELEEVIAEVRNTSDKRQVVEMKLRQHLEDQVKRLRTEQNGSSLSSLNRLADTDEGISSDSESTSTVQSLMSQIHDKEKHILQLQSECLKWEQKYLEEQTLRQMAIDDASTPKDARIAALEQSSVETERLIAEARTERLTHLDEVYQANKKTAELEARVKSLQAQMAERDAMINVLQRHSSLSRCSSISSLLGSPLHSPNPSLLMPSTPSTSPHPGGASPRLSPTTITSFSSPPSGAPSRQNSNQEMSSLLGRDSVPAHTKSNSTGSSSMTNSVGASKETREIQKKLAAQAALFHRLQTGEEEVQGLWQV